MSAHIVAMNLSDITDIGFLGSIHSLEDPIVVFVALAASAVLLAAICIEQVARENLSKRRHRMLSVGFLVAAVLAVTGIVGTAVQATTIFRESGAAQTTLVKEWAADEYGVVLSGGTAREIKAQAKSRFPETGDAHIVDRDGEQVIVVMQPDSSGVMRLFVSGTELEPIRR